MLARNVGTGVAYHRYNYDGYGEDYQGANWTGTGTGRLWPLLAGERGHLAVLAGHDALSQITTMLNMRTPGGLLPEQVWDQPPLAPRHGIPSMPLNTGQRTLSATPLAWAHSELIKLAWTRATGTPAEQLTEVTGRYTGETPSPSTSYWRINVPLLALPADRNLVIEDTQPFTLHYGFDDPGNWTNVSDADSKPLPFGMHGVTLAAAALAGQDRLNFIRHYGTRWDPHGNQSIPSSNPHHANSPSTAANAPGRPWPAGWLECLSLA